MVVRETLRNSVRIADIFEFAFAQESVVVACNYATHRSVAAGAILQFFPEQLITVLRSGTIARVVGQQFSVCLSYMLLHDSCHLPPICRY